jgi:hypothetical protein
MTREQIQNITTPISLCTKSRKRKQKRKNTNLCKVCCCLLFSSIQDKRSGRISGEEADDGEEKKEIIINL